MLDLQTMKLVILAKGLRVSEGASYEDSKIVYACSVEQIGYYGHPKMIASLNKATGWVTITGQESFKVS
jgi:hypothetical protein